MVLASPEAHRGDVVIWGGVIIETQNRPEGTTVMVLETPLDSEGAPADAEYSRGRFLARTPSFLDGEIYQKGRKVTVAGEVVGREIQSLGDIRYGYPVLSVREIHLWREHWTTYGYPYGSYPYWGPYYGYWNWWWPYRRWHYRYW
jgi:outer membrane lipoprotein